MTGRVTVIAFAVITSLAPIVAPATVDAAGTCRQYEPLLRYMAPIAHWDVPKMSRTMWRESHCRPYVRSRTRDSGLLQVNDINVRYLSARMGRKVTPALLMNPVFNVWAGALLCRYWRNAGRSCYTPWNGGA